MYALLIEGAEEEQRAQVDEALACDTESRRARRRSDILAAIAAGGGELG